MKTHPDTKKGLRSKVLAERNQISATEWQEKSEQITAFILNSQVYKNAKYLHSYISINDRNEVNTWNLIEQMLKDEKRVIVPVTNFSDTSLIHSEITSLDDLKPNKWGIHEPQTIDEIDVNALDVVFIPMAAADQKGNRLGYGKGFYDRFLSGLEVKKVGLVFDDFIFEEIPHQDFDIKMDMLVSEKGILIPQQ